MSDHSTGDTDHQVYRSTGDGYWTTYYVDIGQNWRAYHVHDDEVGDCVPFGAALDWNNLGIEPTAVSELPSEVLRRVERYVQTDSDRTEGSR